MHKICYSEISNSKINKQTLASNDAHLNKLLLLL